MINTSSEKQGVNLNDAARLCALFKTEFKSLTKQEQSFIKQLRHKLTKQQDSESIDF